MRKRYQYDERTRSPKMGWRGGSYSPTRTFTRILLIEDDFLLLQTAIMPNTKIIATVAVFSSVALFDSSHFEFFQILTMAFIK